MHDNLSALRRNRVSAVQGEQAEMTETSPSAEIQSAKKKKRLKPSVKHFLLSTLQVVLPAATVYFFLTCIISIVLIYGQSMEPNLYSGDWIIYSHLNKSPQRYDIIVARKDSEHTQIIKRVIGLPGETVDIHDGNIYINGNEISEDTYTSIGQTNPGTLTLPVTLGADEYFVLGDNREESLDSRAVETGLIKRDHLQGTVLWILHTE
jgi:signal peptidase I